MGSKFVVKTDNVASNKFLTQKKVSPKQTHWQDFLAEFDFEIEYKSGKTNNVADALSRKADFTSVAAVTQVSTSILDRIRAGLRSDATACRLEQVVIMGETRRFWVSDGLLYTKGKRLFVPKYEGLRKELLPEFHDTLWAGHPGQRRTVALLSRHYYWPGLDADVEEYVCTCLVCL